MRRLIVERGGVGLRSDGVGSDERGIEIVGSATGFDEYGVLDVRDEAMRGGETSVPVRDGFGESDAGDRRRERTRLEKSQRL